MSRLPAAAITACLAATLLFLPQALTASNLSRRLHLLPRDSARGSVYIDASGKVVLESRFDCFAFFEGRARFAAEGRFGFMDEEGRCVAPPVFPMARDFAGGLAAVAAKVGPEGWYEARTRWGYVDRSGKMAIPYRYRYAGDFTEGLAAVSLEKLLEPQYGYVDATGRWVIKPWYTEAGEFHEGLAAVRGAPKAPLGFIDRLGRDVIRPRFDQARAFAGGLAPASTRRNRWGLIDHTGAWVVHDEFLDITATDSSIALVEVQIKDCRVLRGYLDGTGRWIHPPTLEKALPFSEGRAFAGKGLLRPDGTWAVEDLHALATEEHHGGLALIRRVVGDLTVRSEYVDLEGRTVWAGPALRAIHPGPPVPVHGPSVSAFLSDEPPIHEGTAVAHPVTTGPTSADADDPTPAAPLDGEDPYVGPRIVPGTTLHRPHEFTGAGEAPLMRDQGGRILFSGTASCLPFVAGLAPISTYEGCGFIDRRGRFVIPPRFEAVQQFSEGLAAAAPQAPRGTPERFGYIDSHGEWIISPRFHQADAFSCGRAVVSTSPRAIFGIIDRNGTWVLEPCHRSIGRFSEGLATFTTSFLGEYGLLDTQGRVVVPPRFDFCHDFSEGVAAARLHGSSEWGFIDHQGRWVIEPRFSDTWRFSEGLATASPRGSRAVGFIDHAGAYRIQPTYDWAFAFSDGLAAAGWYGKGAGFLDPQGRWAIEPRYHSAGTFANGLAPVEVRLPTRAANEAILRAGLVDRHGNLLWSKATVQRIRFSWASPVVSPEAPAPAAVPPRPAP